MKPLINQPVLWCEVSDRNERARLTLLSQELAAAGIANELEFIQCSSEASVEELEEIFRSAMTKFHQIRVSSIAQSVAHRSGLGTPRSLLSLRVADSIVRERIAGADHDEWWPRNFLVDGINQTLASDSVGLDLTAPAFVMGTGPNASAAIFSLARVGYRSINIVEPDEEKGRRVTEELRTMFFKVNFQFVRRHLITQMPGIHSIAVNTLRPEQDEGLITELSYFNFLKPGGVWLDLVLDQGSRELEVEARSVHAVVHSGWRVLAATDSIWAKTCFGVDLDEKGLAQKFVQELAQKSAPKID